MLLSEVAALVGGELVGPGDPRITGVAGIECAGPGDLTFVSRPGLLPALATCGAAAAIIGPGMSTDLPAVRHEQPYAAFARVLALSLPDPDRLFPPGVHPTAVVAPDADVTRAAAVGPYCVIGAGAAVGEGSRLGAHVVLGPDVTVGRDCRLHPHVTIREGCRLGDEVILHAGVVVGTEGFGYLPGPAGLVPVPQVGTVIIGDRVEVGAGSCIDRATTGATVIGEGTKIDNQIQIGHNVRIGRHCALSAQTGISGSSVLGDGVTAGGQVGVGDHLTIGDGVRIGGKSGIVRSVPAGQSVFGYPALEAGEASRIAGALRRLPELLRRVAELERAAGKE
ncbi:MAG: UDP-3-O-(3-hydroxymyristoyl)glucosamine N-acyltransferase [Candidatus Krumholzibacteriia bacterium]